MPELPDLEVFKGNLKKHLVGETLLAIEPVHPRNVIPAAGPVLEQFVGKALADIERDGKELLFLFPEGKFFAVHLMLNGGLQLCAEPAQAAAVKYRIASFRFQELILVVSDPGGLCKVRFLPQLTKVPDAFSPAFSQEYLADRLARNPLMNIKAFLIDQKMVKGIGNAYADEILWESRISPLSLCGKLPPEAVARLHAAVAGVLREAIASIRREAPEIISGEIRSFLKVHQPRRKESPTGHAIRVQKVASKTTYFTDEQILY
ncbi:formamidopyrimidine-DNA glycosylase [Hydrogenispora ethanolica]|uniref:Formamidopyrimidine-DNA glycosylase n=1 Tax=Hydrogenispora ethanolica TaxID=1082276 RepID=A0A4R1SBK5_HYDET|nr:DNA-formamidopyrimidine glycosylase family protein [Hydrogenispora ethanolica]TCL76945.1 formamidopyrimidine-DNA glycosylase [Hydrogenispora ethanolica]